MLGEIIWYVYKAVKVMTRVRVFFLRLLAVGFCLNSPTFLAPLLVYTSMIAPIRLSMVQYPWCPIILGAAAPVKGVTGGDVVLITLLAFSGV